LNRCLQDIDTVFLVLGWRPPLAAVEDPRWSGIAKHARRIVCSSPAPLKTPPPFFQAVPILPRDRAERIEWGRLIENVGTEVDVPARRHVRRKRPALLGPQIRAGDVVRWPYLDAPTAPTDERDLAAVAVRALCEDGTPVRNMW
jgi:hypothetical protein